MGKCSRLFAVLLVAAFTGCEFGAHPVAPPSARPIVHAVLNPGAASYAVLVEEMLTGRVDIDTDVPFVESDPIRTGSGVPINGAQVVIFNVFGDSAIGAEEFSTEGGTGVYRFSNAFNPASSNSLLITAGATYRLKVTTPAGAVVTGSTTVPEGLDTAAFIFRQFNRDNDTLFLDWPHVQGAKTYLIRVNTPRGPYHIFTESTYIRLPGSLRDFFSERLPSVFVPGFDQTIQVSAIETNFYDYYRSQNNPFTGSGLINHLEGGTGLFGAIVTQRMLAVETVANQDLPVEGFYEGSPGFASAAPSEMMLYVDARHRNLAVITGNYERAALPGRRGVIGFQDGTAISLAFLREQLASDTTATFNGTLYGADSIVGTIRATGERIVYRKVPPALTVEADPRTRRD